MAKSERSSVILPEAILQLVFYDARDDPDVDRKQCAVSLNLPMRRIEDQSYILDTQMMAEARRNPTYRALFSALDTEWDTPTGQLNLTTAVCRYDDSVPPEQIYEEAQSGKPRHISHSQAIGRDALGNLVYNPYFSLRECAWYIRRELRDLYGPEHRVTDPYDVIWRKRLQNVSKAQRTDRKLRWRGIAKKFIAPMAAFVAGLFTVEPSVGRAVWHRMRSDYERAERLGPEVSDRQCIRGADTEEPCAHIVHGTFNQDDQETYRIPFSLVISGLPSWNAPPQPGAAALHPLACNAAIYGQYVLPSAHEVFHRTEAIGIEAIHAFLHDAESYEAKERHSKCSAVETKSCMEFQV